MSALASEPSSPYRGDCWRTGQNLVEGWAIDTRDPRRRVVVELLADGVPLELETAEAFVPVVAELNGTDRCYGFQILLGSKALKSAHTLRVRVANTDQFIGPALDLRQEPVSDEAIVGWQGAVQWMGGTRLTGWLSGRLGDPTLPLIRIYEEHRFLMESRELEWTSDGSDLEGHYEFDITLPLELADGRPHRLRVIDGRGRDLRGSPIFVIAHPSGTAGIVHQLAGTTEGQALATQYAELVDRLLPGSIPFNREREWRRINSAAPRLAADLGRNELLFVAIQGREGAERTRESLSAQADVRTVVVDVDIEDENPWRARPGAWQAVFAEAKAQGARLVVPVLAGTELEPDCLRILAALGPSHGTLGLVYADCEVRDPAGANTLWLKPAFDYERMLSQGYLVGVFGISPDIVNSNRIAAAASVYDLPMLLIELMADRNVGCVHVPFLAGRVPSLNNAEAEAALTRAVEEHMAALSVDAQVEGRSGAIAPALSIVRRGAHRMVDVIIPTRDRVDLLRPCVEGLLGKTDHPITITIVDNGSVEQETAEFLAGLPADRTRIIRDDLAFNYSRLNNRAVETSAADLVCLLNNDIEILHEDWLANMVAHLRREDVGGVGAMLIWPNEMVQHGGVVLGTYFGATHSHNDRLKTEPGYADELLVARQASAVTAACLLVRKADYLAVGGLDEVAFPVAFNDVDLCLKLRARGKEIVWTPNARLLHRESASRGTDVQREKEARFHKELGELRRKWGEALMSDPFYHPFLNADAYPFTGLALKPRPGDPRRNSRPVPYAF